MALPLATILRPEKIDDIIGQEHLLSKDSPLRRLIEDNKLSSLILWGPAGTGKTTIARVIAKHCQLKFIATNATSCTVKDIRKQGDQAVKDSAPTVIFIDEVHRFSTTQQDVLLPYVEEGIIIFIGATTENPYHSINSALISRSHIFALESLTQKDLFKVLFRGVEHYRKSRKLKVDVDAIKYISTVSCGDARKVLSILELAVELFNKDTVTLDMVKTVAPSKYTVLTNAAHYDLASAYQGSIQASDPDAAVFWLAKWLESGEDPRYIARRLLVSAAEDAFSNPICMAAANAAYTAAANVGRPECDIVLSAATILVATSPRDKSAAKAIWTAVRDVRENVDVIVPRQMRDCHYPGAEKLGHGAYHDGSNQPEYVGVKKKYFYPVSK